MFIVFNESHRLVNIFANYDRVALDSSALPRIKASTMFVQRTRTELFRAPVWSMVGQGMQEIEGSQMHEQTRGPLV